MQKFSKPELISIIIILGLISIASFFNFRVSLRRARDAQRASDMGSMETYLDNYKNTIGSGIYPKSEGGRPIACVGPGTTRDPKTGDYLNLAPCEWGKNSLLGQLPIDPQSSIGISYEYFSDGYAYQFYASLEGTDEAEFKSVILTRNLFCGSRVCNAGKANGQTPLDKSIEEYENEMRLLQLSKLKNAQTPAKH
jgi:type II secretory pathway pseudopilin PulG